MLKKIWKALCDAFETEQGEIMKLEEKANIVDHYGRSTISYTDRQRLKSLYHGKSERARIKNERENAYAKGLAPIVLGYMAYKAYEWDQEAQNISKRDRE